MNAAHFTSFDTAQMGLAIDIRRDGIAYVVLECARGGYNALTPSFAAQLSAAADRIEQDASIAAAVITGDARGRRVRADSSRSTTEATVLGTDIELLKTIKFATDAERLARDAGQLLKRLSRLKKPVVAAVQGTVLGGVLELALACHAIVAADDPRTTLGFHEVRLGLIPSANGMLRVAARAGLRQAIDIVLSGKRLNAARARALGIVDEVCPWPILLDVAARKAKALVGSPPGKRDERMDVVALALEKNPLGRALLFAKARERSRAKTHGHYPAPERALDVLEAFGREGFDAAADLEAKVFGDLVVSETAHRLIELHCATTALKRSAPGGDGQDSKYAASARAVDRIGIVGGGLVGSGIAYVSVVAGLSVRLKEKDDEAAGRALRAVSGLLDARVAQGKSSALERVHLFSLLSAATDYSGLRHADLVIEAVFEDVAFKRNVVRDVEALVADTCVLASSTSSIPIALIAQAARRPERVIGMHFFSPVAKVPLLEVVRADKTDDWAVATAVAIGRRQRKTVIVVKDAPGFYTTRILAPLVHEAAQLLAEGLPMEVIDQAMRDWGFPMGPLRLLDEVGIDVAARVAQCLHEAFGERMTPPRAITALVGDERHGRKNRRGLYRYDERPKDGAVARAADTSVYALLGVAPTTKLPVEEIQMRCALSMINEAVRCFGEGIIRCPRDGDVGAVLGLGFPPFRGGPFRYIDTIGAADALRRVQGYADRFGERWRPAPLLVHMARKGERFYA